MLWLQKHTDNSLGDLVAVFVSTQEEVDGWLHFSTIFTRSDKPSITCFKSSIDLNG